MNIIQGFRLVLEHLEYGELRLLWFTSKRLRPFYRGLRVWIWFKSNGSALVIPSEDFFEKLLRVDGDIICPFTSTTGIAYKLMQADYVEEAVYVLESLKDYQQGFLATLALCNGSLRALSTFANYRNPLSLQELVKYGFYPQGIRCISFVSSELYEELGFWSYLTTPNKCLCNACYGPQGPISDHGIRSKIDEILEFLYKTLLERSRVTLDYFAANERLLTFARTHWALFKERMIMVYWSDYTTSARQWGYHPANLLVHSLNRIKTA